ncbi:winged helix-turn-helix domain-containing protein [Patescibacteria group bacterium]|nr:winged helix-turn-helix domain-containing protein [Patescibacteria group bacterium]
MFDEGSLKYRDYVLDRISRRLYYKDTTIPLKNKEFSLLEYFMMNIGRVLTRIQIIEDVWDRNICWNTNTVDVHVSRLRSKLFKQTGTQLIETVYCVGYILNEAIIE